MLFAYGRCTIYCDPAVVACSDLTLPPASHGCAGGWLRKSRTARSYCIPNAYVWILYLTKQSFRTSTYSQTISHDNPQQATLTLTRNITSGSCPMSRSCQWLGDFSQTPPVRPDGAGDRPGALSVQSLARQVRRQLGALRLMQSYDCVSTIAKLTKLTDNEGHTGRAYQQSQ